MPVAGPAPRNTEKKKKPASAPAPGTKARGFRGPGGSGSAPKTDYAAEMKAAEKKGDKKAFYTAQRERAKKTGDQKMLASINKKLGRTGGVKDDPLSQYSQKPIPSPAAKAMSTPTRKQQAMQTGKKKVSS